LLPPRDQWRPELRGLAIDEARAVMVGPPNPGARLSPQRQVILGRLLVLEEVGREKLGAALWGAWGEPPLTASNIIRVQVTHLRQALGRRARVVLLHGFGYRLEPAAANDNASAERVRHATGHHPDLSG
jgi:DNA-binding response OmpR family regulator